MKYVLIYTLFLMSVFHTSCGQNQTNPPKDNIKPHRTGLSESQLKEAATSKVPMSMVRNVKQARNGDILIASYLGVFRYDGKSFTNLTSKISSAAASGMFWKIEKEIFGSLPRIQVFIITMGNPFRHFTTKDGLASNTALHIYEDKAGNIWFAEGASRYDGKSFRNFTTKDGFPSNNIRLLLEDKTGNLVWCTRRKYVRL